MSQQKFTESLSEKKPGCKRRCSTQNIW